MKSIPVGLLGSAALHALLVYSSPQVGSCEEVPKKAVQVFFFEKKHEIKEKKNKRNTKSKKSKKLSTWSTQAATPKVPEAPARKG